MFGQSSLIPFPCEILRHRDALLRNKLTKIFPHLLFGILGVPLDLIPVDRKFQSKIVRCMTYDLMKVVYNTIIVSFSVCSQG